MYDCILHILYYILAYIQHSGDVSLENRQLHVPAALPPWKETPTSVRQMAVCSTRTGLDALEERKVSL